jgi:quercetin dioxygenase-like cupin family protein
VTFAGGPIKWEHVDNREVLPGIARQRIDGAEASVIRYVYQPGSTFPTHHHPEEQTTIVLSGQIEFWLGDERVIAGPGDTLLIPANVPHGARVVGSTIVESINVMAPVRRSELVLGPS